MPPGGGSTSGRPTPRIEEPPLPVATLPSLRVKSMAVGAPAAPLRTGGTFTLTPAGCASSGASSGASGSSAAAPATTCSGFRIANGAPNQARANGAVFSPAPAPLQVDAFNPKTYELGTLALSNGGYMVPADAGTTLVPVTADLALANIASRFSGAASLRFVVTWSPGGPGPVNTAGLFVLVTRGSPAAPAPRTTFNVTMAPGIDFTFALELLGFVADAARGKDAAVLGDWGAAALPAPGQPGPRVAVKQGAGEQVVRLIGRISRVM
jgi:hypothetical protein